jgi:hypothetical protein
MKLTLKDKNFLEKLKVLLESKELSIELKEDGLRRFVLRQNYGDRIQSYFNLTRQGVRWRFQRLFNEIYINSYLAVYWVESNFGTELRKMAMEVARERVELSKKVRKMDDFKLCRRENRSEAPRSGRP